MIDLKGKTLSEAEKDLKELGQKVNDYIVNFRQSSYREELKSPMYATYLQDNYLVDAHCPRFGSGEAKGVLNESVRGKDLFIMTDVCNYSLTYSVNGLDIDPRLIFFLTDLDVLAVSMTDRYAILTKIISTFLRKSFADLIQNPLGGLIDLCHQQTPPSSPFAHLPQPSCVNRVGRTFSRLPYCFTSPSSITMILSAIRMIRS